MGDRGPTRRRHNARSRGPTAAAIQFEAGGRGDVSIRIALTTDNYPTPGAPNFGTFVERIAAAWGARGARIDVIAPMPRWSRQPLALRLGAPTPATQADGVHAVHPLFTSLSNARFGPISARSLGIESFVRAALAADAALPSEHDLAYGHFLYRGGAAALAIAKRRGIPAVVALGEATFDDYERDLGIDRVRRDLARFDGVLVVADWIRDRCVERFGVDPDKILVEPNGIDATRFHPIDRQEARRHLGLPIDRPIVAFVGHFIERKGPLRVLEAISRDPRIAVAFIGDGPQTPASDQVLFAGRTRHEDIAHWLSACDVFALPTLAEGSCNAILEAMACGCAIVSSDIASIEQLTGRQAASLVDPNSIDSIGQAIADLIDDEGERRVLAARALERSERFSIDGRATRILTWLRSITESDPTKRSSQAI
jgi:teichuronic acid biosynthesis glycosyltransferase TuaC